MTAPSVPQHEAYALLLADALDRSIVQAELQVAKLRKRAELIRQGAGDKMTVFNNGFHVLAEMAELTRTINTEGVARAYGVAMHYAPHDE